MLSLSARVAHGVVRPARLGERRRPARLAASVPSRARRGIRRRGTRAAAAADDDGDDDDDETTFDDDEYDEAWTDAEDGGDATGREDDGDETSDASASAAAFARFSADLDARAFGTSGPPPRAAYAAVVEPSSPAPQPAVKPMSGAQNGIFNVGLVSTAVLVAWGVKRAADAFNRIPNLNAEERLMRMADFAAEALERAKAMPDGPRKDKEIARVTALIADVDAKRAKVEAAERKRREWSERVMRVDEDGVSVRSKREAARRERRAPASARRARRAASDGDDDDDARDSSAADLSAADPADADAADPADASDASELERSRRERDARYEAAMERARSRERAPPGAGARWMNATEYLQRRMDKTAVGYRPEEDVEGDEDGDEENAAAAAAEREAEAEVAAKAKAALEAAEYRRKAEAEAAAKAEEEERELERARAMAEAEARAKAEVRPIPPKKVDGSTPPSFSGKAPVFEPDIVDNFDDLRGGNLSPQDEVALEREIRRLEERYGDDRNVSAEELDAKCQEIIDRYGLGEREFTKNETYDPRTDPKMAPTHYSQENPFYWRTLRAVHPIFEADPASKTMGVMTMMMTLPGLPAYLPGNKKPADRLHAIAFERREDAERFCWYMRSTRVDGEGVCTTQPMPPATLEEMANETSYGVTVVGGGRVDLSPSRSDVEILAEIREIGGEQYLWEFARYTRDELEESRKPPPPTVRY